MVSLHHVQIAIPAGGEDRARDFYGRLLGLPEIAKPEHLRARGGVWFQTETLQLHLGVDPGALRVPDLLFSVEAPAG